MLTAAELVKLIKAHNKLSQIKIPAKAKTDVNALIKLVEAKNYKVNHSKKRIEPKQQRGKIIDLKKADEVLPKPKTELQKQKAMERKELKAQEEKKKLRQAKKEAVEKFKKGQKGIKDKSISKNNKDMKKETKTISTQTETKKSRPKVDPKKIKVIEPKKKTSSGMPSNDFPIDPNKQLGSQNPDDEYEKVKYKNINEEITDLLYGARQIGGQYSKGGKVQTDLDKVKPEDLIRVTGKLKTKLKKDLDILDGRIGKSLAGVSGEVAYTNNMKKLREELLSLKKWDKYFN